MIVVSKCIIMHTRARQQLELSKMAAYLDYLRTKIPPILRDLLPFGLSIKLVLGAALTVLGGAGFLGYVSDYATYTYSIRLGFRVPLEGVPYVKAAVTTGSLFLLLTCALIFAGAVLSLRFILLNIQLVTGWLHFAGRKLAAPSKADFNEMLSLARDQSLKVRIAMSIAVGIVMVAVVSATVALWPEAAMLDELQMKYLLLTGFLYGFVSTGALIIPAAIWPFSFLFTAVYFAMCLWVMFQTEHYGRFLRVIGYGGGFPVTIQCKKESGCSRVLPTSVSLILRTNDTFVVYDGTQSVFLEIPKSDVENISYRAGGLDSQPLSLPGDPMGR